MGSKQTTLIVSNLTNYNINKITTSVSSNSDWDGNSRPDHNFNNISLSKINAIAQREELNDPAVGAMKDGIFDMSIEFENNKIIEIKSCHQKDAGTKYRRVIASHDGMEVCQTSGAWSNGLEIRDIASPDNSRWMEVLLKRKPEIKLNEICMPGSHDAGMYVDNGTWGVAKKEYVITQDDPFSKQLKAGIRYFDIRVKHDNNCFYTYHGGSAGGGKGGKLEYILNDIVRFLTQNGTKELIILKFSHTDSHVNKSDLVKFITERCGDFSFKSNVDCNLAHLMLKNVQRKLLLVFDSEFREYIDIKKGILPYYNYSKEYPYNGLSVFDTYSDTDEFTKMKDGQLGYLNEFGGFGRGHGYLFLFSWTLTGKPGLLDVGVLSSLCRPWLSKYINGMKNGTYNKPNIIYLDFLDPWLGQAIISVND